jgi:hypothetical protein
MRKRISVLTATIVGSAALGVSAQLLTPSAFAQPSPGPSSSPPTSPSPGPPTSPSPGPPTSPSPGPSSGPSGSLSPGPTGSPSVSASPTHTFGTPNTAGGLPRDPQGESQLSPDITADRNKIVASTGGRFVVVSAFYKDPNEKTSDGRPAGVIFIGGTGAPYSIDPTQFVASFKTGASPNPSTEVNPGAGGGKAVCSQDTVRGHLGAYCAWATGDEFGLILPTFDKDVATVSDLMRKMRPDLEGAAH